MNIFNRFFIYIELADKQCETRIHLHLCDLSGKNIRLFPTDEYFLIKHDSFPEQWLDIRIRLQLKYADEALYI